MTTRRAYTLVEMLAAATLSAMVIGMAASSLHLLLRAERALRGEMRHQSEIARLAEQFRDDVHNAATWAADPAPGVWRFGLADGRTVVYAMHEQSVGREESGGQGRLARESFGLPPGHRAVIELPAAPGAPFAVLRLRRTSDEKDMHAAPTGGLAIEALPRGRSTGAEQQGGRP